MPRKATKSAAMPAPATDAGPAAITKADAAQPPAPPAGEDGLAALLATATGTTHRAFSTSLLSDTARTLGLPADHPDRERREAALFGLMKEFAPRDGVEGALAAAFAALHTGALQLLASAAQPEVPAEHATRFRRDAHASLRVAFEALGALQNFRGKVTKQVLTIERLALGEGAQAIIGTVEGKPRG